MKEAIGSIPLYNFIIIFIVVTFGFLMATLTYYKAFKLNSKISYSLEKYEGYNSLAVAEIDKNLTAMGYRKSGAIECPIKSNTTGQNSNTSFPICIYELPKKANGYFTYGVMTYIYVDIPIVGATFKIPVYTETERIYEFSKS